MTPLQETIDRILRDRKLTPEGEAQIDRDADERFTLEDFAAIDRLYAALESGEVRRHPSPTWSANADIARAWDVA